MRGVGDLAAGQVERDRQTIEVGFQVDLGDEGAARASKGLAVLAPFAPVTETRPRMTVDVSMAEQKGTTVAV